jgi:cell division protein ZapA
VAEKNRIEVKIAGKTYTLMGVESDEYMQRVALYIDKKMNGIMRLNSKLSTSLAAVLTAVNVADDYFKSHESNMSFERELQLAREEIQRLNGENTQLANENSSLTQRNTNMQLELVKKETEVNEARNNFHKAPRPRPNQKINS